ncbi:hypothetical protein ACJ73_09608 [Blastomyces percursus]|uniref:SGNH hydrolase-type esterase domain-containing protein n=1 Tax=Blastomyces percursus TaxID=1658174 RepID=A0A1J9Q7I2_9EURO|nr:hypothetical protein ACJ73_09608 [Blastomyces percursus]
MVSSSNTGQPFSYFGLGHGCEIFKQNNHYYISQVSNSEALAGGADLRILPLGDSITYGQGNSNGNGYRLPLHNLLSSGNKVEYIGHEKHGSMSNNRHEGHKGFPIGPVGDTGKPSYTQRLNIVLLLAGTNDVSSKSISKKRQRCSGASSTISSRPVRTPSSQRSGAGKHVPSLIWRGYYTAY